ncbi:type 4 pilus major pilin [Stenotrophomonas sp. NPDC077464]|uniref:type 4 pilus major pilin n=1 Tax=unclassified Stenotrophomonas TaxID=196198 RepID=UPI0037D21F86
MYIHRPDRSAAGTPSRGFSLVEVLLVLGVSSAIAAAGWLLFGPTSVAADVKQTQLDFSETASAIERSLGIVGGYSGLSTSLVRTDGLAAQRLRQSDGLRNVWGGSVSFWPNTVKRGNDSFLVETSDVPKAACAKLVAAMAGDPAVWDAQVNGESIYLNNKYDPANAATACEQDGGDRLGFVYFSGLASGSAVATLPPTLPTVPPSIDPANPSTPTGPVTGAPSVGDATPGTPVTVAPAAPPPSPPVVPGAPPAAPVVPGPGVGILPTTPINPPSLTRCTPPGPDHQDVAACPAGTWGMVHQTRTWACPEAWASPEPGPWANAGNACVACPGPETESSTQWVGASQACPTGQAGAHTWEAEQVATRQRSYGCPAGTTAAPGPTYGGWSAWSFTGTRRSETNTCATQGLVVVSGFVNLSVANAYGTVGRLTLTEATNWTYLAGQSSDWSSTWGPVRGDGSLQITYNGATATVSGAGSSSNTARPGSPTSFTASNQTLSFNGKLVEFEFRGNASTDNGSVIRGSVAFYYRVLP